MSASLAPVGLLLIGLCASTACGRSERSRSGSHSPDGPPGASGEGAGGVAGSIGQGGAGARGGSGGRGGSAGEGGAGGGDTPDACESPTLPDAPLLRLTDIDLDTTVHDLFGPMYTPSDVLPPIYSLTPALVPVSQSEVDTFHRFAHDVAVEVTANDESLLDVTGCNADLGEDDCRRHFLEVRLPRLIRRPLEADEVSDYDRLFDRGVELAGGFAGGVRAVVEVALQSPEFLYRVELGEPLDVADDDPRAGWGRPTPFEMASRLSYLYWRSAPDDELFEAAARGDLRDRDEIAAQARRLLADRRAKVMVRRFYFDLLRVRPDFPAEEQDGSPLSAEIAPLLVRETEAFIDHATFDEPGDFTTLLTAPVTWVNADLASYYGISGVSGDELRAVELDPTRRGGILTQGSFLATHSNPSASNPFQRGLAIYNGLLCMELPPPPNVLPTIPDPMPGLTTRQRWEQTTALAACSSCHHQVDALGFAFEHFDQAGLWRDAENGLPVDASGELTVTDAAGRYDGAMELASLIANSDDAKKCFCDKWLAHMVGRLLSEGDACSRSQLDEAFASGNVLELLLALTESDAFLYRPLAPGAQ